MDLGAAADRLALQWAKAADAQALAWKEHRRRRRNLEAMAWVALLAFLAVVARLIVAADRLGTSETCILLGTALVGLGLIVRLLILALSQEGDAKT